MNQNAIKNQGYEPAAKPHEAGTKREKMLLLTSLRAHKNSTKTAQFSPELVRKSRGLLRNVEIEVRVKRGGSREEWLKEVDVRRCFNWQIYSK